MIDFVLARTPKIIFGKGKFKELPNVIAEFGKSVLLINGGIHFCFSEYQTFLTDALKNKKIAFSSISITHEPSPSLIDDYVKQYSRKKIDVIAAIGGGSVIDAGKAISAMLFSKSPTADFLEGVGKGISHNGKKAPFIAVPTTAGTGSEATKNAVLSNVAASGFKKSLRHDNFVPDVALVDPELTLTCPPEVSAACGMDAFTQLLESYVSVKANPVTDALAMSGIAKMKDSLIPVCTSEPQNIELRTSLSYAALLSGITLANAGLGIIHGLASSLGGLFDIPHGVICGTLLAGATRLNIERLRNANASQTALEKYGVVGKLFSQDGMSTLDEGLKSLVDTLSKWTDVLKMPRLGNYGVKDADIPKIVKNIGVNNNPVTLSKEDITKIISERI